MILSHGRLVGIGLVVASAVLWSTAGLFVRMADMDIWSMVAWRSAFSFVTLGTFVMIRNLAVNRQVKLTFGREGIAACAVSAVASITYIASLQWTTVANVMTVYATLPFVATGIAFIWLRERVTYRFIIAGILAFLGVVISLGSALSSSDMLGIVAAFVMTGGCAIQLVIARRYPTLDTTMLTVLAALVCLIIAVPLMQFSMPTPIQLLACALYGILTTGIAYVLLLMGSRLVGSGEAGLLSMLDVVLGPIWVLVLFGERIALPVLVGGGLVLVAVTWYLLADRPRKTVVASVNS